MYEKKFPNLQKDGYTITSEITFSYNCIAWAASDNTRRWWPDPRYIDYWPEDLERDETIEAFIICFQKLGYTICHTDALEDGYEKVAIYTSDEGEPTHAARQLSTGRWTSKLGDYNDIEHSLHGLDGEEYGTIQVFLKRPTK